MEGEQRVRLMMEADINQICELEKKCFSEPWSFNLIRSGVAVRWIPTLSMRRGEKSWGTV